MSLLNEIQQKLKVPKGQYNAFAKYNYRNAEDILEAVKPLLGDAALILSDEVVSVGNRNYVKATAFLTLGVVHEKYCAVTDWRRGERAAGSGKPDCSCGAQKECFEAVGWAREPVERKGMDDSQITGATSSYARKYALNGLFCIDDTKDADTNFNTTAPYVAVGGVPLKGVMFEGKTVTLPQNAPKQAPVAPKAPWVKNDPTVKIKAAKDRILKQLDMLKLAHGTREECEASVLANTGLPLIESKLEEIGDRLALIIEENNTK